MLIGRWNHECVQNFEVIRGYPSASSRKVKVRSSLRFLYDSVIDEVVKHRNDLVDRVRSIHIENWG